MRVASIRTVLVVDDDELTLSAWRRSIGGERRCVVARTASEALGSLAHARPDLALVDMRLGSESGLELIGQLRARSPQLLLALYSAYVSIPIAVAAVHAGAHQVFAKPVTFCEVLRRFGQASAPLPPEVDEPPTLARIEWEHIWRVLDDCDGNVSMAARRLGIYRSSLQRKLRKAAPRA